MKHILVDEETHARAKTQAASKKVSLMQYIKDLVIKDTGRSDEATTKTHNEPNQH